MHELVKITGDGGFNSCNGFTVDVAGGTVKRDVVAFIVFFAAKLKVAFGFVNSDFTATGNTADTHAAGNNRCVGCHAAANGKNALSGCHAFNVFG